MSQGSYLCESGDLLARVWLAVFVLVSPNAIDIDDHASDVGEEVSKVVLEVAHLLGVTSQDHLHPLRPTQ